MLVAKIAGVFYIVCSHHSNVAIRSSSSMAKTITTVTSADNTENTIDTLETSSQRVGESATEPTIEFPASKVAIADDLD